MDSPNSPNKLLNSNQDRNSNCTLFDTKIQAYKLHSLIRQKLLPSPLPSPFALRSRSTKPSETDRREGDNSGLPHNFVHHESGLAERLERRLASIRLQDDTPSRSNVEQTRRDSVRPAANQKPTMLFLQTQPHLPKTPLFSSLKSPRYSSARRREGCVRLIDALCRPTAHFEARTPQKRPTADGGRKFAYLTVNQFDFMRKYEKCTPKKPTKVAQQETFERKVTPPNEDAYQKTVARLTQLRDTTVFVSRLNLELLVKDVKRLLDHRWLNDELINFWIAMLTERQKLYEEQRRAAIIRWPKCHYFNSFFYMFLSKDDGYQMVRRWTRRTDIFSFDKVIIPIHLANHWCLAVINFCLNRIEYYDPLGGGNAQCTRLLREYILSEWKDKKSASPRPEPEKWKDYIPKIPYQQNGSDCGVFVCMYMDCISRNAPFNFSQADMPKIRRHMLLSIVSNKCLDPHSSYF
ncbi:sentrin-specific protease 1-like [Schistocerca gregaria]|uniref:sentrin-specific protease 1-like n=1 Tax=Schistocerca gregaria TaxID=7010 RepID=UPI00211E523B|nr:sentrin-specific protease 1-like [Schistocerca gregaria]